MLSYIVFERIKLRAMLCFIMPVDIKVLEHSCKFIADYKHGFVAFLYDEVLHAPRFIELLTLGINFSLFRFNRRTAHCPLIWHKNHIDFTKETLYNKGHTTTTNETNKMK